jgi:hypothetical protein
MSTTQAILIPFSDSAARRAVAVRKFNQKQLLAASNNKMIDMDDIDGVARSPPQPRHMHKLMVQYNKQRISTRTTTSQRA